MKRIAFVLLAACASGLEPADPVWGKEPCSHCMMLVSEREPAAQLISADGTRRFFDDVGCMVAFSEGGPPKARWVHLGDGWVPAETARYAPARTPMDFGFVAAVDGISFDELREKVRR
jgi:hypothetical protein